MALRAAVTKMEEDPVVKKHQSFLILESKTYIKKQNPTGDKALWVGWHVKARSEHHNVFVTVLRRKYVPPLLEKFQDITLTSKLSLSIDSIDFLKQVHHTAADTLHSTDKFTLVYKNLIDEKANALLMDSETINFNQYNLGVLP